MEQRAQQEVLREAARNGERGPLACRGAACLHSSPSPASFPGCTLALLLCHAMRICRQPLPRQAKKEAALYAATFKADWLTKHPLSEFL